MSAQILPTTIIACIVAVALGLVFARLSYVEEVLKEVTKIQQQQNIHLNRRLDDCIKIKQQLARHDHELSELENEVVDIKEKAVFKQRITVSEEELDV